MMEIRVDLWRCVYVLKKWMLLIALVCIAVFAGTYYFTINTGANMYAARSSVYATTDNLYTVDQSRQMTQAMQQYVAVATSTKVLANAAELMGHIDGVTGVGLTNMVSASFANDTSMITITARSVSPRIAMSAANAVAAAFTAELTAITGRNLAQVLDVATSYSIVYNARSEQLKNCIIAAAGVGVLFCMAILAKEVLSNNVTSLAAVSLDGDLEVLGVIPRTRGKRGGAV